MNTPFSVFPSPSMLALCEEIGLTKRELTHEQYMALNRFTIEHWSLVDYGGKTKLFPTAFVVAHKASMLVLDLEAITTTEFRVKDWGVKPEWREWAREKFPDGGW